METPIPNFYFMGVQFLHLLALSVWMGGIVAIKGIVSPILFKSISPRQLNTLLMSEFLKQFNRITLFCAGALIVTGMIKFWAWENLTPWNTIRYFAIIVMSLVSFYLTLKGSDVKSQSVASATETLDEPLSGSLSARGPQDLMPDRLMMVSFVCGLTALVMA